METKPGWEARIETALRMGRERKAEMVRNLAWATADNTDGFCSGCNCQSCQWLRAYHDDLLEILT